eukprot:snap_masked-scaffold_16-processed-gene-5.47-mRNA-1 protein AED:1.00 eAED:1.00 QI:0/0/0/0/1/1/2/0/85
MYALNINPDKPKLISVAYVGNDGYAHGAWIMVYVGPSRIFSGMWYNIQMISRTRCPNAECTHQGWLAKDMRWVALNDEYGGKRSY